jgi:hypothetical protein
MGTTFQEYRQLDELLEARTHLKRAAGRVAAERANDMMSADRTLTFSQALKQVLDADNGLRGQYLYGEVSARQEPEPRGQNTPKPPLDERTAARHAAGGRLDAAARALLKENPGMSYHGAMHEAMRRDPDLKRAYAGTAS